MKQNKKGFTLIEIIVVIVILAVLMAVAVPSVLKYMDTAQEAPALTECHAIVTAAQKRVIEKYAKNHDDNVSLDDTDNKWIEDFVNEGGKIQGTITVTNKEVIKLTYLASNGLYVLYDKNKNPEYSIISKNEIENPMIIQLNSLLDQYYDMTIELAGKPEYSKFLDRSVLISLLGEKGQLPKVDEKITKAINSKTDLYWKPYYLGSKNNPSMVMYANSSPNDRGKWNANLIYVNGQIYTCSTNIAFFSNDYCNTPEKLQSHLDSHPETYTKIDVD